MNAKHPHDEVIRAWLDGKTVQVFFTASGWRDVASLDESVSSRSTPNFSKEFQYRIKPETIRYRVMLVFDDGSKQVRCCHPSRYEAVEKSPNYLIRWLGDEQEVEVAS